MEKSNMIQLIINKLQGIGIYPKVGQETDIEILKEFLDAKFSTGEKKITYKSFALFDDANKILYYYENTKEESKGFSFGVDSESSFQSGTTLFRKVKSVGYAPDGKAYEYEIDIGQITKIFKEVAKENGWKFKVVLNPKKAKYGTIVPSNSINDNKVNNTVVANSANVSVATNEEKQPIKEVTKVQNNNVINNNNNNNNSNNNNNNSNNNNKSNKKTSTLVYIITSAIAALYLLLLDSNIIGWVITIVIFVVLILKRDFIQKMSIIKKIIMWILIFIIIFFIGAFTMQNSTSNDNSNTNTSNNNISKNNQTQNTNTNTNSNTNTSNNTSNKSNEKTPYYATAESYNVLNGYEYIEGSDYKQIKPYTSASILISINNSNVEQNTNIKSIKIKNAKATKSPKMGTPQFYFYDIITENDTNKTSTKHLFNGSSFEYSIDDFKKLQAIQFYYGVVDVKTQDVSTWSVIESDKAISKSGVTSDDVRSTISFEIEITDVNNKKYSRVFTQEIFSGDFLNNSTSGYISKYYNGNEILYFQEN